VDIQDWTEVRDPETGAVTEDWQTVWEKVPARIAPASGREFLAAAAIQSEIIARIVIRERPGLKAKQRILHNGDIYDVHAWLPDPDSGRDYVSAPVSRGVIS
jgi:SPP1 family predicted phage head-tail adaptor